MERVVRPPNPDDCWLWIGKTNNGGYGRMYPLSSPAMIASRASYILHVGPVERGVDVCHTCDNPPCCNPRHLFVGTRGDNMRDCKRKGRTRNRALPGSQNGRAKMTEADVSRCRALYRTGELDIPAEAKRLGVTWTALAFAVKGTTWRHVERFGGEDE